MTSPNRLSKLLAIALSTAAVAWTAAVILSVVLPSSRASAWFAASVHAAGSLVCHQRAERSFHVGGRKLPVCARCTGLYVSGAAGAMLGWMGFRRAPQRTRRMLVIAALPTAATLLFEWLGLATVSNGGRALASVPLGGVTGWLFVRMLRAETPPSTCAMIA